MTGINGSYERMISEYRREHKLGYAVPDEAVLEMIEKEIAPGKIPAGFESLAREADQTRGSGNSQGIFGMGFACEPEDNITLSSVGNEEAIRRVPTAEEYVALSFLGEITEEADRTVRARETEAGGVSYMVNLWQEMLNQQYAKSTVKEEVEDSQKDLEILQKASLGQLSRFNFITMQNEEISFEDAFKKQRGVEFDKEAILDCQNKADAYTEVKTTVEMINIIKSQLGMTTSGTVHNQMNPEEASAAIIKAFQLAGIKNLADMNKALRMIESKKATHPDIEKYGGEFRFAKNKQGEYVIYRTDKSGYPSEATNEQLRIIAEEMCLQMDKTLAQALGVEYNPNATAEEMSDVIEQTYEKYQKEYEESFAKAYGGKDLKILSEAYVAKQQQGVGYVNMGFNIILTALMFVPGGGAVSAGAKAVSAASKVSKVIKPAAAVLMTLNPIELAEQLTSENGMSKEEWSEWGKGVLQNTIYMAAGMGVSKLAETGAAMYKTRALVSKLKQGGKSIDEITAMVNANPLKFPQELVTSLKKVDRIAKSLQISSEAALDISSTYLLNHAMGNGDLTAMDWINSVAFAIVGGGLQKQFMYLSTEDKVRYLQNSFKGLDKNFELSHDVALRILNTMDDISAGKSVGSGVNTGAVSSEAKVKTDSLKEKIQNLDINSNIKDKFITKINQFNSDAHYEFLNQLLELDDYSITEILSHLDLKDVDLISNMLKNESRSMNSLLNIIRYIENDDGHIDLVSKRVNKKQKINLMSELIALKDIPDDILEHFVTKECLYGNKNNIQNFIVNYQKLSDYELNPIVKYTLVLSGDINAEFIQKNKDFISGFLKLTDYSKDVCVDLADILKTDINAEALYKYINSIDEASLSEIKRYIPDYTTKQLLYFLDYHMKNGTSEFDSKALKFSQDLTEYLVLKPRDEGSIREIFTAYPLTENHIGSLPADWSKNKMSPAQIEQVEELLDEFAAKMQRERGVIAVDNEKSIVNEFRDNFRSITQKDIQVEYIDQGNYGTVYKLSVSNAKPVVIKIYFNDASRPGDCGANTEIPNAIAANTYFSGHSAEFYYGKLKGIDRNESGYMISEYIDKNADYSQREKLNSSEYKLVNNDSKESNSINGIIVDFGCLKFPEISSKTLRVNDGAVVNTADIHNRLGAAVTREEFAVLRDEIKAMPDSPEKQQLTAKYLTKYNEWSRKHSAEFDIRMEYKPEETLTKDFNKEFEDFKNDVKNDARFPEHVLKYITPENIEIARLLSEDLDVSDIDIWNFLYSTKEYNKDISRQLILDKTMHTNAKLEILDLTTPEKVILTKAFLESKPFSVNDMSSLLINVDNNNLAVARKMIVDNRFSVDEMLYVILPEVKQYNATSAMLLLSNEKLSASEIRRALSSVNEQNARVAETMFANKDFPGKYLGGVLDSVNENNAETALLILSDSSVPYDQISQIMRMTKENTAEVTKKMLEDKDFPREYIYRVLLSTNKDNSKAAEMMVANKDFPKDIISGILYCTNKDNLELALKMISDKNFPKEDISSILTNAKDYKYDIAYKMIMDEEFSKDRILSILYNVNNDTLELVQELLENREISGNLISSILYKLKDDNIKIEDVRKLLADKDIPKKCIEKLLEAPECIDLAKELYVLNIPQDRIAEILNTAKGYSKEILRDLVVTNYSKISAYEKSFKNINIIDLLKAAKNESSMKWLEFLSSETYTELLKQNSAGKYQKEVMEMLDSKNLNSAMFKSLTESGLHIDDYFNAVKKLSKSTFKLAYGTPNQYLSDIDTKYSTPVNGKYPELPPEELKKECADIVSFFQNNFGKILRALKYIDTDTVSHMMDKRTKLFEETLSRLNTLTDANYELLSRMLSCKSAATGNQLSPKEKIQLCQIVEIYQATNIDMTLLKAFVQSNEVNIDAAKQFIRDEAFRAAGINPEVQVPADKKIFNKDFFYLTLYNNITSRIDSQIASIKQECLDHIYLMRRNDSVRKETIELMEDMLSNSIYSNAITNEQKKACTRFLQLLKNLDKYTDEQVMPSMLETVRISLSQKGTLEDLYTVIREATLGDFKEFITNPANKYGQTNLRTQKAFEQEGLNYDKWLNPDIEDIKLNIAGKEMSIKMWERNPQEDLFIGNKTTCCTAIGTGSNAGATPVYLLNTAFNVVELYDSNGNVVGMSRVFMGKIDNNPVLIMDNIELNKPYIKGMSRDDKIDIRNGFFEYMNQYAVQITGNDDAQVYFYSQDIRVPSSDLEIEKAVAKFVGNISQENVYVNSAACSWINPEQLDKVGEIEWLKVPRI